VHTVTIELLRSGESYNHALSKKTKYIALCGNHPPVDLRIHCEQKVFNKYKQKLNYKVDEKSRQEGIAFFERLITDLLDDIGYLQKEGDTKDWLHLRLVMTPGELAQLPFELALTPKGFQGERKKRFLMNPQRLTTLTREVRQVGSAYYIWPYMPRILFAWAEPADTVPHEDHLAMLVDIVRYFAYPIKDNIEPVPDVGKIITELKSASLKSINDAVKSAIREGNPYTHIHMLAHGIKNESKCEEYRLVLHSNIDRNKSSYANGDDLANAIEETVKNKTYIPAVVSLMACDSSNTGSISLPAGSLAHQLHESGIPCVFASQFPLTKIGSVKLVSTLYKRILAEGDDPREALYYTRKDLEESNVHDWASLVAHVRFPEDIDEQLKDNRLKILLHFMKTANGWTDHILEHKDKIDLKKRTAYFEEINDRLDKSLSGLKTLFEAEKDTKKSRYAEHCGLIGSAYKRKAEHLFRMADLNTDNAANLIKESVEALKSSRECYLTGYKEQKNHWTAVQYLSLQAVIQGSLANPDDKDIWTVAKVFAEDDIKQSVDTVGKVWAWGSLAELFLLKPLTLSENHPDLDNEKLSAKGKAKHYMDSIANAKITFSTVTQETIEKIIFAQESTHRQFNRYINWWPVMMESPSAILLKELAIGLLKDFSL
jgi:hypothetical protein